MTETLVTLPLGEWAPDIAALGLPTTEVATNVYPAVDGFDLVPAMTAAGTGTFSGTCYGAAVVVDTSAFKTYVYAGSGSNYYRMQISGLGAVTTAWTDVTGAAPPSAGSAATHTFVRFGNYLLTQTPTTALQEIDILAGTSFAATAGSPPRGLGVAVIGDFVAIYGTGTEHNAIRWSSINDRTGWTVGTNLCDEQTFPDPGQVVGMTGDKSGYVLQEGGVRAFQFLPGDTTTIFQFVKLDGAPGCVGPDAWAVAGTDVFYVSYRGLFRLGAAGLENIGSGKVNNYFIENLNPLSPRYPRVTADPQESRVYFSFTDGNGDYTQHLVYDYSIKRWSLITGWSVHAWAIPLAGEIDLLQAGYVSAGAIDTSNRVAFPRRISTGGSFLAATVTYCEQEITPGFRTLVTDARAIGSVAAATIVDKTREKLTDAQSTTSGSSESASGRFSLFAGGRFHQFTMTTSSSLFTTARTYLKGLQVWAQPDGEF